MTLKLKISSKYVSPLGLFLNLKFRKNVSGNERGIFFHIFIFVYFVNFRKNVIFLTKFSDGFQTERQSRHKNKKHLNARSATMPTTSAPDFSTFFEA